MDVVGVAHVLPVSARSRLALVPHVPQAIEHLRLHLVIRVILLRVPPAPGFVTTGTARVLPHSASTAHECIGVSSRTPAPTLVVGNQISHGCFTRALVGARAMLEHRNSGYHQTILLPVAEQQLSGTIHVDAVNAVLVQLSQLACTDGCGASHISLFLALLILSIVIMSINGIIHTDSTGLCHSVLTSLFLLFVSRTVTRCCSRVM